MKWNFQANISFNKNKIGGLSGDQFAQSLWSAANQAFLQRNGCPIGTLYGYVEDGSSLRMKYITLSYNWQHPFKNIGIDHINLSFTANNVFTITNSSWMDSDVNAGGNNAATPVVDSYSYPSARSFTLGLNVVF